MCVFTDALFYMHLWNFYNKLYAIHTLMYRPLTKLKSIIYIYHVYTCVYLPMLYFMGIYGSKLCFLT